MFSASAPVRKVTQVVEQHMQLAVLHTHSKGSKPFVVSGNFIYTHLPELLEGKKKICIFKRKIFRQSLPKYRLFKDRLIMLFLISVLPRAQDQGSATASSGATSSSLGVTSKGLFCCQPPTPAKSKASCLKLATEF